MGARTRTERDRTIFSYASNPGKNALIRVETTPNTSTSVLFSLHALHSAWLRLVVARRCDRSQRDGHAAAVFRVGRVPLERPDAVLARGGGVELGLQVAAVGLPEEPVAVEDEAGVGVVVRGRGAADLDAVEGRVGRVDVEVAAGEVGVGRVGADGDRAGGRVPGEGDVGGDRDVGRRAVANEGGACCFVLGFRSTMFSWNSRVLIYSPSP